MLIFFYEVSGLGFVFLEVKNCLHLHAIIFGVLPKVAENKLEELDAGNADARKDDAKLLPLKYFQRSAFRSLSRPIVFASFKS